MTFFRILILVFLFTASVDSMAQRVVEKYPNGQKKYQGRTENNLKTGTHKYWYENGELQKEEKYNDLGAIIRLREWNEQGDLIRDEKPEEVLEGFREKLFEETNWIGQDGIFFHKLKGANELQQRTDYNGIVIHYATYLENGKELDNSFRTKSPLLVQFNSKNLVDGFLRSLRFFEKGDNGYIKVPYDLAYGKDGAPGIPGYANIYFHVLVLDIR